MWENEDETASAAGEEVKRLIESGELTRGLRRADRLVNWSIVAGALALVVAVVVWEVLP